MGVLAPGSAHARPSTWPPINTSGNFSAHMSGGGGDSRQINEPCTILGKLGIDNLRQTFVSALPSKRQLPADLGYTNCNAGYFDAQGFGVKLDYCRWVGNGGCRNSPSYWSCALAGKNKQYTPKGMFIEP